MRSPITRGVSRLVRTTQTMVSQIVVSVAAAVCVAFITNAYLSDSAKPDAAEVLQPATAERTTVAPVASQRQQKAATVAATTLPPLDVEIIADVPAAAGPSQEIFPGVPVGMSPDTLQQTVAVEEKKEWRRFLGIPIPFASTAGDLADSAARAGAGLVDLVSGG